MPSDARGYVVVSHENITDRTQVEDELQRAKAGLEKLNRQLQRTVWHERLLARTDYLTGVSNRRHFLGIAAPVFSIVKRYRRALSVMMIDIDHSKQINDTFGHHIGDELLKRVAQTIQTTLREADILARYGGEEFIALLPNADVPEASDIAERIRENVARERVDTEKGHAGRNCVMEFVPD